ncbi:MAG: DUF5011 domain-containing protein [Erysipelothrix sp.]|nr:DUF5011 domain-containing protein [Erysipelothrix sp.]
MYLWHKDTYSKLTLLGSSDIVLKYGDNYEDAGALVKYMNKTIEDSPFLKTDLNLDKIGSYSITYEYKWIYHMKSVTRNIEVIDDLAPSLSLKGDLETSLKVGDSYQEQGYNVEDNYDDTVEVLISGTLDTETEGTYELTYLAKDSSNNQTELKRIVKVYKPIIIPPIVLSNSTNKGNTNSTPGVIYLSFDDGPHPTVTSDILDTLKEEGVKATFFVTGKGPDALIVRAYNEGHTIALHTYSHLYSDVYASVDNYYSDLNKVSDRVTRLTQTSSSIIRFQGEVLIQLVVNIVMA